MGERRKALEETADYADFYADERMRLCGDSILHDPLLSGKAWTRGNVAMSKSLQIVGTINSAAYHAAKAVAEHLRKMAAAPDPTTRAGKP